MKNNIKLKYLACILSCIGTLIVIFLAKYISDFIQIENRKLIELIATTFLLLNMWLIVFSVIMWLERKYFK